MHKNQDTYENDIDLDIKSGEIIEIEANGMTTPGQRAEYKAEKLRATYSEKMAELFQDLEP